MPRIVFDASSLVGALLKAGSVPVRALLLARTHDTICLSDEIEREIREVFIRPRFVKYLTPGRTEFILDLICSGALRLHPAVAISDCRDAKDRKYLALAIAASAEIIVSSDADLLMLNPWRGIATITPAEYVRQLEPSSTSPAR